MKVNIFEGSAVGIPAYADAHFCTGDFDLVKALSSYSIPVRRAEIPSNTKMAEEELTPQSTEESEDTSEEETTEEDEDTVEEQSEEQKSFTLSESDLKSLISGVVSEAIKSQRGLIDEKSAEEKLKEEISKKSVGELAMQMGFFKQL